MLYSAGKINVQGKKNPDWNGIESRKEIVKCQCIISSL